MNVDEGEYLRHYGILRRSGRYPWGSGKDSYTRSKDFLGYLAELRREGLTDVEITRVISSHSDDVEMNTTQLRQAATIARAEKRLAEVGMATRLKDKGLSNIAIGKRMGIGESSVRELLKHRESDKLNILTSTADMLRKQVAEKTFVDVGAGVEIGLRISKEKLASSIALLKDEGYQVHTGIKIDQLGTGQKTDMKILVPPGVSWGEAAKNKYKVRLITETSGDGGRNYYGIKAPIQIDPKRIKVRYAEDGGTQADGTIDVRRGVDDVSLGGSNYAQVRVAVKGGRYLKGMASYRDDLPDGVDLVFNTNKKNTGNDLDAMKKMTDDPDNPFGAVIRQIGPKDSRGRIEKVTSAMNLVNEEGNWNDWSRNQSSQFLSKQRPRLASKQLDMTYERKLNEFNEIMKTNHPAVRKRLLEGFADSTDSSSVHLKAAAMPGQRTHVILPMNSMKPTEVYAPNYENGTRVVLVRYPHGGTFEIPELIVNNKHPDARKIIGTNAPDAIGIHHKVAERLSGADFDGDTVLVIPNPKGEIRTSPALEKLKGFDPQIYKLPADSPIPRMTAKQKGTAMGDVSNLITDMTIKGAPMDEIARAVRHSMVVIDAEKHELNYKQSAIDNGIAALKIKYQGRADAGASTLISRATSRTDVLERKPRPASKGGPIDPETGKKVWEYTGRNYINKEGKVVDSTDQSQKLAETDDAHTLSSGTRIERIYADHSNRLKDLANKARKELHQIKGVPYSTSAKKAYAPEVASLNAKLNLALENAPRERQAQVLANARYREKLDANPNMDDAQKKKIKSMTLEEARVQMGAKKERIDITDREWEAIQAGAITNHKLNQILTNTDLDKVKALATPRSKLSMTKISLGRAKSMLADGYTQAEVADHLGVSLSTLENALNPKNGG